VEPGTSELFALDNDGQPGEDVCGVFTWDLVRQSSVKDAHSEHGRRLAVSFAISHE
jgi:hypothetical protein